MVLADLLHALGEEIQDPEEESFLLFAQADRSSDLGFLDPRAQTLELTVAGKDLVIEQSPTLLKSERAEGTTGAVVWKITPLFAEWIAGKGNVLFDMSDTLSTNSTVLELGCGVSGIVALATSTKVGRYIATDQEYVFKILKSNLEENASRSQRSRKPPQRQVKSKPVSYADSTRSSNIEILALDWESNSVSSLPDLLGSESPGASREIDAVVACDCIYNEALIDPFVQTCVDICRLPKAAMTENPTICIIAQQLRSHAVFETWLLAFQKMFRVWRVPDQLLTVGLLDGSGYVIHIAILRDVMG